MKISVVTAVFNGRDTIEGALESVARQDYPHIEHIVIDGASTDGTSQIVESWRGRLGKVVIEPDKGIYDALNKGIRLASGDAVGFLHADDIYADDGVVGRIAAAFEDPAVDAVYGDLLYVRRDDTSRIVRYWRSGHYSRAGLSRGWMPPHPTFYVRRRIYERLGGFDTSYRIAADYDCMLRFLTHGAIQPAYIPQVLVKMRLGGESNRSFANILKKSREDLRALSRNRVGGIGALLLKNVGKLGQFFAQEPSRTPPFRASQDKTKT